MLKEKQPIIYLIKFMKANDINPRRNLGLRDVLNAPRNKEQQPV